VLGPDTPGSAFAEGLTQQQVREFVYREARIAPEEMLSAGVHLERRTPSTT
jgi:hypothetical protein